MRTKSKEENGSASVVKTETSVVTKAQSPLAQRGLKDLTRLTDPAVPQVFARRTVTMLYADEGMEKFFHKLTTKALGESCHIVPVWEVVESEIRLLWKQRAFNCAILVLNNILLNGRRDSEREILRNALELIQWLHNNGSATIIAFSSLRQTGLEEEARRKGADAFFYLPFPPLDFERLLKDRFGPASNTACEEPGRFIP